MNCQKCHTRQWSANDINYLNLFDVCWDCDKENWQNGLLSLKEFERREIRANNFNTVSAR